MKRYKVFILTIIMIILSANCRAESGFLEGVDSEFSSDKQRFDLTIRFSPKTSGYKLGNTLDANFEIDRVFVDLFNTKMKQKKGQTIPVDLPFVKRMRIGQFTSTTTRVVIDTENIQEFTLNLAKPQVLRLSILAGQERTPKNTVAVAEDTAPATVPGKEDPAKTELSKAPAPANPLVPSKQVDAEEKMDSGKTKSTKDLEKKVIVGSGPSVGSGSTGKIDSGGKEKPVGGDRVTMKGSRLIIRTIPAEVEVYLDDEFKGVTPFYDSDRQRGKYKLKLIKDNYRSIEKDIEIKEDDLTLVTEILNSRTE